MPICQWGLGDLQNSRHIRSKRKVDMEKEKCNVPIDENGTRHASVPMWQKLPQIKVRLKDGHTTYQFSGSFDGKRALPEKVTKLIDEQPGT